VRFILSTIGTSILTNLIDRANPDEGTWFGKLRDSANLRQAELPSDTEEVMKTLADRALEKLLEDNVVTNRRISAELNGIYGIYNGNIPDSSTDQHYLICTDTAQGQKTGELIEDFLSSKGFTVSIVQPSQLSTKDTQSFAAGTKELIKWLDETVPRPDAGYQVIFNLVGGFKSLQGYMQTFGAFYADEIVYIFEGSTDLIRIPRLPIQIDNTLIETHKIQFALMAAGKLYPIKELNGIPETLLESVEENGKTYAGLSAWGELVWHRTKADLLGEELLPFPRLTYTPSFHSDLKGVNSRELLRLQEALAKVVSILESNNGNPERLSDGGIQFERFQRHDNNIYRFRITRGIRASCKFEAGQLTLLHYGQHQYVDDVLHAPLCTHC